MSSDDLELLGRIALFGGLRPETVRSLLAASTVVERAEGDLFFEEGERGGSVFVVRTGRVAVEKLRQGHPCELATLGPGDCFGEMALIDMCPRSASVRAVEPTVAFELPAEVLQSLCRADLEQFTILQMNMGREVSRRLRGAGERLSREAAEPPGDAGDGDEA